MNEEEERDSGDAKDQFVECVWSILDSWIAKEYRDCNKIYIDMTLGRSKWHQDVCVGEARHNKGYNARKVYRSAGTEFMENENSQKYVLGLKRLITRAQDFIPNEDSSKRMDT